MLKIQHSKGKKIKGQVFVSATASNNEILHNSETLTSLANAFKNIKAAAKEYAAIMAGKKPVLIEIESKGGLLVYERAYYNVDKKKFIIFAKGK